MSRGAAARPGIVLGWLLLAACRDGAAAGPPLPPAAPAGSEAFTEMVAVVHVHSSVSERTAR